MNIHSFPTPCLRRGARAKPGDRDDLPARDYPFIPDVIEAGDGKDWFQLPQRLNPDLIASDGKIPRANGHAHGKKVQDEPEASRILVVLLTGQNPAEYRIEGIISGAVDCNPNQPALDHLKARIRNLLESRYGLKAEFATPQVPADTGSTVASSDGRILAKVIKVVEEHMIDDDFSVDRFSQLMGMSRSTLKRKLKSLTGLSPQPFVQQLRLKRAARLLTAGGISISETARMVGFYDPSHFGRVFKKHFECTPSHFGQRAQARTPVEKSPATGYTNPWPRHQIGPNPRSLVRCLQPPPPTTDGQIPACGHFRLRSSSIHEPQ